MSQIINSSQIKNSLKGFIIPIILLGNLPLSDLAAQSQNSLLYEVTGKGLKSPSYIYGTIHIICEEDFFVSPSTEKALAQAKKLFLEIDLSDADLAMKMQMALVHPEFKNIKDFINEEEKEALEAYFKKKLGAGLDQLGIMKPFALSSMLTMGLLQCEGNKSYEEYFMTLAQEKKIPIAGLESLEDQIKIFDAIPYEEQVRDLVKMVIEPSEGEKEFEEMMRYYKAQDAQALYSEVIMKNDQFANHKEVLLDNRNKNWIPVMLESMKKHSTFVAVGAGHLAGEQGVLELLRKAGYQVKPVQ